MSLQKLLMAAVGLVLITTSVVSAQQTPSTSTPGSERVDSPRARQEGARIRRMKTQRRTPGERRMDALTRLNITEEQRQLQRGIRERNLAATRAQREQLAQVRQRRMEGSLSDEDRARFHSLRREMRTSMQSMRSEMRNTLNAEQRSQLDAMREQRRQRREEFMNRREELRRTRPTTKPIQPVQP